MLRRFAACFAESIFVNSRLFLLRIAVCPAHAENVKRKPPISESAEPAGIPGRRTPHNRQRLVGATG